MKKIEAYIRHEAFEPIRRELLDAGIPSLTIIDVKGSGRQQGITESYRGSDLVIHMRPKLKLECGVDDSEVDTVIDVIQRHARSGEIGDGKIFIFDIEDAIRIRTGERGASVMQAHEAEEIPTDA
jgi:nitrogen regulatory protein PII